MRDVLARTLATQRVEVALMSTMAALALLLSSLGIFALVASIVAQKRRETGLRLALGSTITEAMVHMGAPGIRSSALGLIVGLVLCAGALRTMSSVIYGVRVYDVPTIIAVMLILTFVTIIATIVPTLQIARTDPASTLREE
jgi:ABC-type antimicrobial peptide transport system permease subunit